MNTKIFEKRMDMDLLRLSIPGIYVYAIFLPLTFWLIDFYTYYPSLGLFYSIFMPVVSACRLVHLKYSDKLYEKSRRFWLYLLSLLLALHAAASGSVLALVIHDPIFSEVNHRAILAIVAIAASTMLVQVPKINIALLNLGALILPLLVITYLFDPYDKLIIVTIFYCLFQSSVLIAAHKNYFQGIRNEATLKEQHEELARINKIDSLTQIYNRGFFNSSYSNSWELAARNQLEQTIIMIDIDHFKSLNDQYGHLLGDQCLIAVAKTIDNVAKRKTDVVARFGGEEFIVLMTNTKASLKLAEDIRKKINDKVFNFGNQSINITVSIGVASMKPVMGSNSNTLLYNADIALYQAKEAGRNRVCHYSDDIPNKLSD
jgi:diguanylate cyclase (GGDEF)-like protein